jgi:hypothetical protein
MTENFTPGPWRWWTSNSVRRLSSDVTGKAGDVVYAYALRDGGADIQIKPEDAALIVEAPILYRELAELVQAIDDGEAVDNCWTKTARAALARARGDST